MRISDWSSDVCSSDLVQSLGCQCLEHRKQGANGFANAGGRLGHQAAAGADGLEHRLRQLALPGYEAGVRKCTRLSAEEYGRASCRARVCQCVMIAVVVWSLYNKKDDDDSHNNI